LFRYCFCRPGWLHSARNEALFLPGSPLLLSHLTARFCISVSQSISEGSGIMSHPPSTLSLDRNSISVLKLDEPKVGQNDALFAGLLEIYQGQGYQLGYRRAKSDTLATLVMWTEQYLQTKPSPDPELRRTIYAFTAFIEAQLQGPKDADFVAEGLGI
jgi:hypothetical protein